MGPKTELAGFAGGMPGKRNAGGLLKREGCRERHKRALEAPKCTGFV